MITRLQKWGNSQGIRFSRDVLREANLQVGDEVEVKAADHSLIVKQTMRPRSKHTLKMLLDKMPRSYKPVEERWGEPVGRETW